MNNDNDLEKLFSNKLEITLINSEKYAEYIDKIYLFGSYATGRYNILSDIDLMIILKPKYSRNRYVRGDIRDILMDDTGTPKVDIIFRTEIELSDSSQLFNRLFNKGKILLKEF